MNAQTSTSAFSDKQQWNDNTAVNAKLLFKRNQSSKQDQNEPVSDCQCASLSEPRMVEQRKRSCSPSFACQQQPSYSEFSLCSCTQKTQPSLTFSHHKIKKRKWHSVVPLNRLKVCDVSTYWHAWCSTVWISRVMFLDSSVLLRYLSYHIMSVASYFYSRLLFHRLFYVQGQHRHRSGDWNLWEPAHDRSALDFQREPGPDIYTAPTLTNEHLNSIEGMC